MGESARAAGGAYINGNGAQANGTAADEVPVASRLDALGQVVPPPEIAELWVFPPLAEIDDSEEFFLFTRFFQGESRRVYSARVLPANGSPAKQIVVEHGTVPANRVSRLVGRLQRRIGQTGEPRHVVIDGRLQRWEELLEKVREEAPLN
jgi:hypothetical protein